MKLLFDESLSPDSSTLLTAEYPDSAHVRSIGLRGASDRVIWEYAKGHGFTLVSEDNDFWQLSFLYRAPREPGALGEVVPGVR